MKRILCFALLLLSLLSCDRYRIYEDTVDFESKYWASSNKLRFPFTIKDTVKSYNILYKLRYSIDYPYYNLYLKYALKNEKDSLESFDLQQMNLLETKTGKPLGQGLGDIFDIYIYALKNVKFKQKGKYTFETQQFMRVDSLPEILSFGIRLEEVKPEVK